MPNTTRRARLSAWDVTYAVDMAIACLITYWVVTLGLARLVDADNDMLGGMWAVIATVFVFRESDAASLSAGLSRLIATCVSFALCLAYLSIFRATPEGMAILLAIGALIVMLAGRREDIVTTGVTTAVVMVVAAISPSHAWEQPLLRLGDTVVGIAVGVGCRWAASALFSRLAGEPAR